MKTRLFGIHPFFDHSKSGHVQISDPRCVVLHAVVFVFRSNVFKTMFLSQEFAEAKSGRVEIKDLSPPNLQKLIDFIYKGKVNL